MTAARQQEKDRLAMATLATRRRIMDRIERILVVIRRIAATSR
jgi:hypothetical protein